MDVQATKLELIELLLRTEEESVLLKIREIFESSAFKRFELTEADYRIIDLRRERHLSGHSEEYSWDEVKEDARESLK